MSGAIDRFMEAARVEGLEPDVRRFPEGTKTAADAAAGDRLRCGQIVKSLVFIGVFSGDDRPVMAFTCGANRVDEARLAELIGAGTSAGRRRRRPGRPPGSRWAARRRSVTPSVSPAWWIAICWPGTRSGPRRERPTRCSRSPRRICSASRGPSASAFAATVDPAPGPRPRSAVTISGVRTFACTAPEEPMISSDRERSREGQGAPDRRRPRRHRAPHRRPAGRVLGSPLRHVPGRPGQREGPDRGAVRASGW